MWILESNGDFLQGKRMWLKPGKKYLFGRVKKDGVRFAIDHKTVSRKHFVISVDEGRDEDFGHLHVRSKLTITDENSKAGTNIDGQLIRATSQEVTNETVSIRPGSCPHELLISWVPCILSFHLLKKEIKSGVLKTKQDRVKELDIKAISDFLPGKTTHLIVQKRNTPKGLQALIDARPLVAESYVDALIYSATPTDLGEEENLCPLEIDFDDAWPDPAQHLPPPGKEPTSRPAKAYAPDPARSSVFENFTFIFLEQSQYDSLLPPITMGHGKVLLHKITPGQSTMEDVVTFMRNAAGQKHFGDENKASDKGGVIMVRQSNPDDQTNSIVNQVALKLDQRAIDQGDFLDAILANDAFLLRQAVPYETYPENITAPPSTARSMASIHEPEENDRNSSPAEASRSVELRTAANGNAIQSPSAVEGDVAPRPKRTRFIPTKTQVFKNFDDDFDPESIAAYEDCEQPDSPKNRNASNGGLVEIGDDSVKEEPRSPLKRPRSSLSDDDDSEMNEYLPGAAALKRQKLAKEAEARQKGTTNEYGTASSRNIPSEKSKKEDKEIDVREAVRARRRAEDEAAKKDAEAFEEFAHDAQNREPANVVQVHGFELPVRERTAETVSGEISDRWDPKWNGRKNFKKFRRARDMVNGERAQNKTAYTKLIVPVAEMKRSMYGLSSSYRRDAALEEDSNLENGNSGKGYNQRHRGHRTVEDSDEEILGDVRNGNHDHASPELDRLRREAAEVLDHDVDLESPRRTRAADTQAQTQSSTMKKRPASSTPAGRATAGKKQKTLPVTVVHDSDSESNDSDDMKFKFGRGKRGMGKGKA